MSIKTDTTNLTQKIHKEFPKLKFKKTKLIVSGGDHLILILDNRYVFRFPRDKKYEKAFKNELGLLHALGKTGLPTAIPQYEFVSKKKDFGGYAIIDGAEFDFDHYRRLPKKHKTAIARQLATFLKKLHSCNPNVFISRPIPLWSARQYEQRYKREGRHHVTSFLKPKTLEKLDEFFRTDLHEAYRRAPRKNVIHGDLSDDHIYIKNGKVSGIIDFSDATIGDPAFDFTFFWFYGDDFIHETIRAYGKVDNDFSERSRAHFVRFVSRNLWQAIERKNTTRARWWLSYVERHLSQTFIFRLEAKS